MKASLIITFLFFVVTSVLPASVVTDTNIVLGPGHEIAPGSNYSLTVYKNEAGTSPATVFIRLSGSSLSFAGMDLDIGADWYLTSFMDAFSEASILGNSHQPLGRITASGSTESNVIDVGFGDFYLGVNTGNEEGEWGELPPRNLYGWVHLRNSGGTLTMLDNAMSYGEKGIVVGTSQADKPQEIVVTNYPDTRVVTYPLALLRGTLPISATELTVTNTSSSREATRVMPGLARQGKFIGLADLVPGENHLVLTAGTAEAAITLRYEPQTNPRIVRPMLYTLSDGNTNYPTPLANDPQNWQAKLGTMMKILQTFTAESLHDQGYPRLTFNLPINPATGEVQTWKLVGEHSASFYYNQTYDRDQLWYEAYDLINRNLPDANAKNLAIIGFSKYDAALNYKYAHVALGGGHLGLMGGLSLWACPDSIADILPTYMDGSSGYPEIQGELPQVYLTVNDTMGAALHELGHALGRPHEGDAQSIMWRGFDRMYRMFTLAEPSGATWAADQVGKWAAESAAAFADGHPWFEYPPPVATLEEIYPDPLPEALPALTVRFDQPVSGVSLSDFSLTKNGVPVPGFPTGAELETVSASEYVIHLGALASEEAVYVLRLQAAGSGIAGMNGKPLYDDQFESWTRSAPSVPALGEVAVSGITSTAAELSLRVRTTGSSATVVTLVWGLFDAGPFVDSWPNVVPLGDRGRGVHKTLLEGLPAETRISFRFTATNSLGTVWTAVSQFTTERQTPSIDVTRPHYAVVGTSDNFPNGESPAMAIDNDGTTKYLNFDKEGSGFTVRLPEPRPVRGLDFISANDAPERDPAGYQLLGSNDEISFTPVASGTLSFPARFASVKRTTGSTQAFSHYRILFPSLANTGLASSVQIGEVQLLEYESLLEGAVITGTAAPDNPAEDVENLNDGLLETKMGVRGTQVLTFVPAEEFRNFVVRGLNLISGNDNSTYHGRSPSFIRLEGSQNSFSYTTIYTMESPGQVNTDFTIDEHTFVENTTAYQRYRLTLGASPSDFMQLSEIQLFGLDAAEVETRIMALSGNLSFGEQTVGQTAQRPLVISNAGNRDLVVSGITYPAGFSGDWNAGTVLAGGSRTVNVAFTPAATGAYGGTIVVNANHTSGTASIGVSGTGTEVETRIIALSGDLSFGEQTVGQTAQRPLVISNAGNRDLVVSGITYPAGFSGDWNAGTVPAGGSRTVNVAFTPSATGSYGGTIIVNANHTSGVATISVSGSGKEGGFEEWCRQHFDAVELADASISGPLADPDRDGIGNFLEFALRKNPKQVSNMDEIIKLSAVGEQSSPVLKIQQPVVVPPGVELHVETSDSLKETNWHSVAARHGEAPWNGSLTLLAHESNGSENYTTFALTITGSLKRFYRLRASMAP